MTTIRAGSKHLIREINEALVLDQLRLHSPIARSTIASRTGLSAATVTGITARLAKAGLISEVMVGAPSGGRPPRLLALNPSGGHVVGIRLSGDHMVVATVDLVGEVIESARIPWQSGSPATAVDKIATVVATFATPGSALLGVGVALSGSVDHANGIVRHSGTLGWNDVPFSDMLSQRFDVPVLIDRYVNAMATALTLYGKEHAGHDLLVVNVGPSLGAAVVQNGKIQRGANNTAGDLAHTSASALTDRGQPCHCGSSGCLETVASAWGMAQEVHRVSGQRMQLATAVRRAANDPRINQVIRRGAQALGRTMANLAKFIDPDQIVVGGDATQLGEAFLEPLETAFSAASRRGSAHEYKLTFAAFDEVDWARGAACQVLASMFSVA
jgi:predicted NBD/HSP70 family sugar kinase